MGALGDEENMAAWLLGVNNLKILPFKLPPLGILSLYLSLSLWFGRVCVCVSEYGFCFKALTMLESE